MTPTDAAIISGTWLVTLRPPAHMFGDPPARILLGELQITNDTYAFVATTGVQTSVPHAQALPFVAAPTGRVTLSGMQHASDHTIAHLAFEGADSLTHRFVVRADPAQGTACLAPDFQVTWFPYSITRAI